MARPIKHNFNQDYSNWDQGSIFDDFYQHQATVAIMADQDELEAEVFADRDFIMANELIEQARNRA